MVEAADCTEKYKGVRAVVLGASGFIGRWVARSLYEQGANLFLIVRNKESSEQIFNEYAIRGEVIEADLLDSEAVKKLFAGLRPSITFNLAGYGVDSSERDETISYQINAGLIETICKTISEVSDGQWPGQDLIHVGSALEYGAIDGDLSEDSAPQPTCLYGRSKLAGTASLARCSRAFRLKSLTARLFTVYGPGEHKGRLLPSLIDAYSRDDNLEMTRGEQRRDFTYVGDVADGLLRLGLAAANPGEVVNLATGRLTPVRAFAETAATVLGLEKTRLQFGKLPTRGEEMKHSDVTIKRLRQLTGWAPRMGISEGIERTLSFYMLKGSSIPGKLSGL